MNDESGRRWAWWKRIPPVFVLTLAVVADLADVISLAQVAGEWWPY